MTLKEAKGLKIGQIVYHKINKNADGSPQRWKVNGMVKTWKRDKSRVKVPIKHGLYSYDYIEEGILSMFSLTE